MLHINRLTSLLLLASLLVCACQPVILPLPEDVPAPAQSESEPPTLRGTLLFELDVQLENLHDVGSSDLGLRYTADVASGDVAGAKLTGVVLPQGELWFLVRSNRISELSFSGILESAEGERINMTARGFCHVHPEVVERACAGELVNPTGRFSAAYLFSRQLLLNMSGSIMS